MAMPKKQMTSTRSGNRRSHINLGRPSTTVCGNCKAVVKPHTVCAQCGFYKGKNVTQKATLEPTA